MEMHQIRYFLAVSRILNFTHAAEECNVAQPSLTRAIKKLEEELGGELFRRERQKTHLTELGRMMLPLLNQCFDGAQSAKGLARSYSAGDRVSLSLAIAKPIDFRLLAGPLTNLAMALPGLALTFHRCADSELEEILKSGDAELGLGSAHENGWDRLNSWPLFSDRMALAVHMDHPLSGIGLVDPAVLAGERILTRSYCSLNARVNDFLAENGVEDTAFHQMANDDDLQALLAENAGIAVLPDSTRLLEGIVPRPVARLDLMRRVCLYEVAGRYRSIASDGLIKLLRSAEFALQ